MAFRRLSTLVFAFTFSVSILALAETTLREKALFESQNLGPQKNRASEVQVDSGVLVLKDPRPEVITRSWKYFVAFSAQQFQPEGMVSNELNSFDLNQNGPTLMPGIEFGFLSKDFNTRSVLWNWGLQFKGSFSSQTSQALYPAGTSISDARLNTTLLSVGPTFAIRWERFHWLTLLFTPEFGTLTYTQTSSSDYGKFSKNSGYRALTSGLDFRVAQKWSVFTKYSQRELSEENQLALQKDNFELGTKVTW